MIFPAPMAGICPAEGDGTFDERWRHAGRGRWPRYYGVGKDDSETMIDFGGGYGGIAE